MFIKQNCESFTMFCFQWPMPFLPMKYPEYRITMEAALPSSVHSWLTHELEQLGIDSLVYTRYIISLLLQVGTFLFLALYFYATLCFANVGRSVCLSVSRPYGFR